MEGKGQRKYATGELITGNFSNGECLSPAKAVYPSGDVYEGDMHGKIKQG